MMSGKRPSSVGDVRKRHTQTTNTLWGLSMYAEDVMTDEEMQALGKSIVESIQEYFDEYDWDKALKRYLEEQ